MTDILVLVDQVFYHRLKFLDYITVAQLSDG
jgi:hypothetical protein